MDELRSKQRKYRSVVEQQIVEAQKRGEFDNLPGSGKPIPDLDGPHDPLWWVKSLIKRENLSALPETLAARTEVEQGLERIVKLRSEKRVREIITRLNARILKANTTAAKGPAANLVMLDPDRIVEQWRDARKQ